MHVSVPHGLVLDGKPAPSRPGGEGRNARHSAGRSGLQSRAGEDGRLPPGSLAC
jgi:hypothetical protein